MLQLLAVVALLKLMEDLKYINIVLFDHGAKHVRNALLLCMVAILWAGVIRWRAGCR